MKLHKMAHRVILNKLLFQGKGAIRTLSNYRTVNLMTVVGNLLAGILRDRI